MCPDAHVHHDFLEQLQAATNKAPNSTQNIGDVLMDMSGRVAPSLVTVTGQGPSNDSMVIANAYTAVPWSMTTGTDR